MPKLTPPQVLLFDWHGTLVNTLDAMYRAIEDLLPQLDELGLVEQMIPETQAKNADNEKLLRYIRIFRHLHPKILAERRISRTDIFDVLFADNDAAKAIAHRAYNQSYRRHYGEVRPFQEGVYGYLSSLKDIGLRLGVVTNRSREFLDSEMHSVDNGRWAELFEVTACGNEASSYKPAPNIIIETLARMSLKPGPQVWYVGDSETDMMTARRAGVTSIFYNGALWEPQWFNRSFASKEQYTNRPDSIVNSFDELLDLIEDTDGSGVINTELHRQRPPRLPPLQPPAPRIEPDWHPAVANLPPPTLILFDWHATLVDTLDAMYHAVDDMLSEFEELGLMDRLVTVANAKSPEDLKLVAYVRSYRQLHPKIKADRKISRTDIFEVLFGDDDEAKRIAHEHFTRHYRKYYGTALPFEPEVHHVLQGLCDLGLPVGVITNRDREFFVAELANVEGENWSEYFVTEVCGDDTERRKPHIDQLLKAARNLNTKLSPQVWYIGDSTTDTIAAKAAGITSVFFNGAQWDQPWLNKIFPGCERYPHKPDVVVNDFSEFWALILACRNRAQNAPTTHF